MIILKETYDKCCPSYKEAVDKLEIKIAQINSSNVNAVTKFEKLYDAVMDFSKSYLTPREYWNHIMESITQRANVVDAKLWKNCCLKIAKRALFHLCYNREWNAIKYKVQDDDGTCVYYFNAYGDTYLKLLNFQNDFYFESAKHKPDFPPYIVTKYDLEYPHIRLQDCMHEYEKKSSRIPSAKLTTRYQKMKPLYHKIKAVEETVTEWFNLLLEVDDVYFVVHNVERRIGLSLFNIKLWKLYIDFLEEQREYKLLLETYSKYCRFFLDDKEMKEKYKVEMIKYGFPGLSMDKLFTFPNDIKKVRS